MTVNAWLFWAVVAICWVLIGLNLYLLGMIHKLLRQHAAVVRLFTTPGPLESIGGQIVPDAYLRTLRPPPPPPPERGWDVP